MGISMMHCRNLWSPSWISCSWQEHILWQSVHACPSCGGDAGHVASSKRFLACRTIRQNFRHVCVRHATSVRAQQDEGLKLKSKSLWPTLWQRRRARASQWSSQLVPHLQNKNLSLSSAHDGDLGHNRNAVGPLFRFTSVLHTCYRKCFFYWLTSFFLSCSTATRDWHALLYHPWQKAFTDDETE